MRFLILTTALLSAAFLLTLSIHAQTTAFNFQGRLNDGSEPANGRYDLQFKLFNAASGGTQAGSTLDRPNLLLINGVFSTTLDFGGPVSYFPGDRFLEISVRRTGSGNPHVILGTRQQIQSVPFAGIAMNALWADQALNSINATNAVNATNAQTAAIATTATNATTAQNALSLGGVPASGYARLSFANQGDVSATNLGAAGYISIGGNTLQPSGSNGFVKAMIAITADGSIARCYNGQTGSSVVPCGMTVSHSTAGHFFVAFPFQVSNRFWIVTNDHSTGTGVHSSSVTQDGTNSLWIRRYLDDSLASIPFHLFVY